MVRRYSLFTLLAILAGCAAAFAQALPGKVIDVGTPTCPISGEKVAEGMVLLHEGKLYHFCCPGCIGTFQKDPAAALAKIKDAKETPLNLTNVDGKCPFPHLLTAGPHQVELRMTDGSEMPYALTVTWHAWQPESAEACRLSLATSLTAATVAEGALAEARVEIGNRRKDVCPMPVAIIGLPGGLEPRHDQLKELVKAGIIDAYEVRGRDVVLYWRAFKPEEKRSVPISLVAAIPGTYTGPAARAYLYYTDEHKVWAPGLRATIIPLDRPAR